MGTNKEYAQKLIEMEGYERKIIGYKLTDHVPENIEPYGDDFSFYCAIVAEVWEGRKPFYVKAESILTLLFCVWKWEVTMCKHGVPFTPFSSTRSKK